MRETRRLILSFAFAAILALNVPNAARGAVDDGPIRIQGEIIEIGRQTVTLKTREGSKVRVPRAAAEATRADLRPGNRIEVAVDIDTLAQLNGF